MWQIVMGTTPTNLSSLTRFDQSSRETYLTTIGSLYVLFPTPARSNTSATPGWLVKCRTKKMGIQDKKLLQPRWSLWPLGFPPRNGRSLISYVLICMYSSRQSSLGYGTDT